MKKKRKRKRQGPTRKGQMVSKRHIERLISQASDQLVIEEYESVISTCQRALKVIPQTSKKRAEPLGYAAIAHLMMQQFDSAYNLLSQAITLEKTDSYLWYNLGLACRFTMRSGKSCKCLEYAVVLEGDGDMAKKFAKELRFSQKMAQRSIELREDCFSLEQLIEQEELFQQGVSKMNSEQWEEAEDIFVRVIEMGDCLPQPWGNLGISFVMQHRYDEAEAAYRRAMEIDTNYAIARSNLEMLPKIRQSGPPQSLRIAKPFESSEMNASIHFQIEQ